MEPGKETEIKGPLNSEQSLALKRLKEAQPHRKNP